MKRKERRGERRVLAAGWEFRIGARRCRLLNGGGGGGFQDPVGSFSPSFTILFDTWSRDIADCSGIGANGQLAHAARIADVILLFTHLALHHHCNSRSASRGTPSFVLSPSLFCMWPPPVLPQPVTFARKSSSSVTLLLP